MAWWRGWSRCRGSPARWRSTVVCPASRRRCSWVCWRSTWGSTTACSAGSRAGCSLAAMRCPSCSRRRSGSLWSGFAGSAPRGSRGTCSRTPGWTSPGLSTRPAGSEVGASRSWSPPPVSPCFSSLIGRGAAGRQRLWSRSRPSSRSRAGPTWMGRPGTNAASTWRWCSPTSTWRPRQWSTEDRTTSSPTSPPTRSGSSRSAARPANPGGSSSGRRAPAGRTRWNGTASSPAISRKSSRVAAPCCSTARAGTGRLRRSGRSTRPIC